MACSTSGRMASLIGVPSVRNTSLIVSLSVENRPEVVLLCASIMPENLPPCEVMDTNARSMLGNPTCPDSTSFFTCESDTPNCLASSLDDRDAPARELVDVLREEPPLDPGLAVEFRDFIDRCLHARGHIADSPQGFGHRVGGFTKGDQLAAGIRQFGKFKRRLRSEFAELGEGLFRLSRIADQGGERYLGLLEVSGRIDRLHTDADCRRAARESRTDTRLESGASHREAFAECRRPTFAHASQSRSGHLSHATGGCRNEFRCPRHGPLQGGDVGSKGDGQGAHAPGMESTNLSWVWVGLCWHKLTFTSPQARPVRFVPFEPTELPGGWRKTDQK